MKFPHDSAGFCKGGWNFFLAVLSSHLVHFRSPANGLNLALLNLLRPPPGLLTPPHPVRGRAPLTTVDVVSSSSEPSLLPSLPWTTKCSPSHLCRFDDFLCVHVRGFMTFRPGRRLGNFFSSLCIFPSEWFFSARSAPLVGDISCDDFPCQDLAGPFRLPYLFSLSSCSCQPPFPLILPPPPRKWTAPREPPLGSDHRALPVSSFPVVPRSQATLCA